jgi:hypothetical protein
MSLFHHQPLGHFWPHEPQIKLVRKPYLRVGVQVLDPRSGRTKYRSFRFVIDTGSNLTLFPQSVADHYNVVYDKVGSQEISLQTAKGYTSGQLAKIKLNILGKEREWPCCFTTPEPGSNGPLRQGQVTNVWVRQESDADSGETISNYIADFLEPSPHSHPPVLGCTGFLEDYFLAICHEWFKICETEHAQGALGELLLPSAVRRRSPPPRAESSWLDWIPFLRRGK